MITLKTITTIELSSVCNLACKYCINRLLQKTSERVPGIMSDDIFEASLAWLKYLVKKKTQKEVNLNGNGESLLDPQIFNRIKSAKEIMQGYAPVQLCTNGIAMSKKIAENLRLAGIDRIDVSPHSPFHARKAIFKLQAAGIGGVVNYGAIGQSHNWAGQLEPEYQIPQPPSNVYCKPLIEGRGYIQSEGNVSPCCYDYRNLGTYGHVFDIDLDKKPMVPFELCNECHQIIPDSIRVNWE